MKIAKSSNLTQLLSYSQNIVETEESNTAPRICYPFITSWSKTVLSQLNSLKDGCSLNSWYIKIATGI